MRPTVLAYVYPGWHACPERDGNYAPGWTEWDLVVRAEPRFAGHRQPNRPLLGRYDDSKPETAAMQVDLARRYGVDVFVHGFFWSRGKRVFSRALDDGFLAIRTGLPFALMWANRMPRRVLPVKRQRGPEIHPARLVHTDPEDFMTLIEYVATRYFALPTYHRRADKPYFSIFDTSFFLRELGVPLATEVVARAKCWLSQHGHGGLHLAAIDPAPEFQSSVATIGFDSVTHYVLLPEWKGELVQDFSGCAAQRSQEWGRWRAAGGLPYFPAVSPGWDASPRVAQHGQPRKRRYPWWPIVTGSHPSHFKAWCQTAAQHVQAAEADPMLFISSWNEWSEGHYLEPDERFGYGWLDAISSL